MTLLELRLTTCLHCLSLDLNMNMKNFPCLILGQDTNPSTSAKNLGVVFDSSLNFRKHMPLTCMACFYHIRDLCRIKKNTITLAPVNFHIHFKICAITFRTLKDNQPV